MIHPDTALQYLSPELGWGVLATRRIPAGTITWAQDPLDLVLSNEAVDALGPAFRPIILHTSFRDRPTRWVQCWDHGRSLNHSCDPCCAGFSWGFEVALRDIEVGEQLTNDYATFNLVDDEGFVCHCRAPLCRGLVSPELPRERLRAYRRLAALSMGASSGVPQPLAYLVSPEQLELAVATTIDR